MLRRTQQRLSCGANTLALAIVFAVVIVHVLHRRSAANVAPGDDQDVVFWFEAGDDGDDQPGLQRPFTVNLQLLLGALGTFFIAALCDAGGVAGACSVLGLFVPLYCLLAGFGLKEGTALAQAAIAGASSASVAFSLFRAHPWDPTRPLLDPDLALLLAPASLLGVLLGVLLNDLLPRWLVVLLLLALLGHVSHREAMLGLTAWHEESQQQAALQAAAAISSGPTPRLRPICTSSSNDTSPRNNEQQQQQQQQAAAAACVPGIVAAAAVESPDSSECSGSLSAAAAAPLQRQQRCFGAGVTWSSAIDSSSSSYSKGDLREPLLPSGSCSDAAAAASTGSGKHFDANTSNDSSSSRATQNRAWHPAAAAAVPFLASVPLPVLPSPVASSAHGAAAAAAAPRGLHSSALFAGHVVTFAKFPWIKFLSVLLLFLGFCGLAVLEALIPLCTWYFVTYMVLLMLVTVLVTFVFIKVILVDPMCKGAAAAKACEGMERGEAADHPAAAAAAEQGSPSCCYNVSSSSSSKHHAVQATLWERLATWANVLAGSQLSVKRTAAAAAAAAAAGSDEQQQQQQQLCQNMSLFRRQQLKNQLQLQQPFLAHNTSFTNVGEAAAAAAAAAVAAEAAQSLLGDPSLAAEAVTLVPPRHDSLVHVAAAGAVVAAAAGVVSGVCGFAGAALLVPTLLDFRVHPQVSAATSVLLVCVSSCAASLALAVQGRLDVSYALLFAFVSIAGVCAGVSLIGGVLHRVCRRSVIMLLLAGLTGAAALCMAGFGAQGFAHDLAEGEGLGFRALCSYV